MLKADFQPLVLFKKTFQTFSLAEERAFFGRTLQYGL